MTAQSPAFQQRRPRAVWASVLVIVLVLFAIAPLAHLAAVAASTRLLAEMAEPAAADTILVLGGDGPARSEKAVELWHAGLAEHVVVAGDGDCLSIRDAVVAGGIPADAVAVECLSRNTWMNALNASPLLEASGTRSALLVTSWFHTGRALRTFRYICPGIRWIPAATMPTSSLLETASGPYGAAVVQEYLKVAVYRLRERLIPPPSPASGRVCATAGAPA